LPCTDGTVPRHGSSYILPHPCPGLTGRMRCNATRARGRVTAARAYAPRSMAALRARAPRQRALSLRRPRTIEPPGPWPLASTACVAFVSGVGRLRLSSCAGARTTAAAEPVCARLPVLLLRARVQCTHGGSSDWDCLCSLFFLLLISCLAGARSGRPVCSGCGASCSSESMESAPQRLVALGATRWADDEVPAALEAQHEVRGFRGGPVRRFRIACRPRRPEQKHVLIGA